MDTPMMLGLAALVITAISGGGLVWYLFSAPQGQGQSSISALRGQTREDEARKSSLKGRAEPNSEVLEELKRKRNKRLKRAEVISLEDKFFQAGLFSQDDRREFFLVKTFAPIVLAPVAGLIGAQTSASLGIMGAIIGLALGLRLPFMLLDRKIKARHDDMMFYLPLVIEQIVIGVSSSLDIGPCLQRVVSMAEERDTHNSVTELLAVAQYHIASGISLQDALVEIGRRSGHTELKHTFMSLAQVASHGGEVSRQLQELADAVSTQRESKIETKIKKLELEATVPVAVVFCGFLIIIISGFGIQIKDNFK